MTDHPEGDLVDLALGHLAADRQSAVLEHVDSCPSCAELLRQLVAGADDVLTITPPVDPPAGFVDRVLGRLDPPPTAALPAGRAVRWGRAASVAAVLAVGGGVAVATLAPHRLEPQWSAGPTTAARSQTADLRTKTARTVGSAAFRSSEGRTTVSIDVLPGAPAPWYSCRTRLADGTTVELGSWSPGTTTPWTVTLPTTSDPRSIELIAPSGATWAAATFH